MTAGDPPDSARRGRGSGSPVTRDQLSRIRALIDVVESEIPSAYRGEIFRHLLPAAVATYGVHSPPRSATGTAPEKQVEPVAGPIDSSRLSLARYAAILAAPGRTLLKALAALDAGASQLSIAWMTPAEIERFLVERARVPSVYRTNVSNALRGARPLADRRRHGRGYEYRITLTGREALERELAILGSG